MILMRKTACMCAFAVINHLICNLTRQHLAVRSSRGLVRWRQVPGGDFGAWWRRGNQFIILVPTRQVRANCVCLHIHVCFGSLVGLTFPCHMYACLCCLLQMVYGHRYPHRQRGAILLSSCISAVVFAHKCSSLLLSVFRVRSVSLFLFLSTAHPCSQLIRERGPPSLTPPPSLSTSNVFQGEKEKILRGAVADATKASQVDPASFEAWRVMAVSKGRLQVFPSQHRPVCASLRVSR